MSLTRLLGKAANARWSIVLTCLAFVFAVGCIGGGDGNNGNNGNNGDMDAGADTTDNDTSDQDTGGGEDTTDQDTGGGDTMDDDTGGGDCTPASPSGACDPLCMTGCEDGQTCQAGPTSDGFAAQCVPTGTAGQGDTCGQNTGCQEGFGCFSGIDPAGTVCLEYCRVGSTEEPQCSDANAECQPAVSAESNIGLCVVSEDACTILGDDCGTDESCAWTNTGNQCFANDDTAAQGDSCESAADCPSDYVCIQIQGDSSRVCRAHCTEADQSNCPDGTQCGGVDTTGDGNAAFFACFTQ